MGKTISHLRLGQGYRLPGFFRLYSEYEDGSFYSRRCVRRG
jgi:hypothetical protein